MKQTLLLVLNGMKLNLLAILYTGAAAVTYFAMFPCGALAAKLPRITSASLSDGRHEWAYYRSYCPLPIYGRTSCLWSLQLLRLLHVLRHLRTQSAGNSLAVLSLPGKLTHVQLLCCFISFILSLYPCETAAGTV